MTRKVAPLVALSFAFMFGVTVWSVQNPAQTTNLYALDQTVSIEGVVQAFIFAGTHATIYLEPLEKTAAGSGQGGVRIIEWSPSSTPLSGQSITQQSLQNGDRVIVTGHPRRQLQDGVILLRTITRTADGWKWLDSGAPKVDTLASRPKVSSQQESKPSVSPATSGGGVPTADGNTDSRLATLEPKVRQMVLEERDAAKVGCEGSAIAMNVYECDCYAREVFEERLRIGTAVHTLKNATGTREITAFATAMDPGVPTGIGACVSTPKTEKYGKELASGLQLNPSSAVSECAGRELAVRFKKLPRPKPELIQPLLIEAMQFCRRSLPSVAAATRPSTAAAPPQTAINAPSNSTPTTTAQPSAISSPARANSSSNDQRRQVFTGSWEFVTRSGESTDAYTTGHLSDVGTLLVITQEGNLLTLGRTPQDAATTYRVDGIEHPFSYRRPNNPNDPITTGTTTATATGDRIVVEIRLQYPDGFRTVSARRVFSLAADGGLLVETTGRISLKNGVSSDLNSSTLYKRSPVSQTSATPAAPATPTPLGTPAPAERASPPPSADTLGERQAKIQSDVAEHTKAVIEELRQKPQAGQPAAATALGTPWQPCEGALRSTQSQTSVAVEFVNSSSEPRKLYWMDFGGMRKLYGTLRPGQRAPMQTYATHSWMVADSSDRCLGTIVIGGPVRLEIR